MIEKIISHYRILKRLGEGGMGEVYLAEDTSLGRLVAIKFLTAKYSADPDFIARFKQEARVVARLNHPNIVTIHEIDEHTGIIYIVMEYVDGESLKDLIRREKLSIPKVIEIVNQVGDGLGAAHRFGVVHRDIKPGNILLSKTNHVKIVDFGIAKLQNTTGLTLAGSALGTPHYMAPEQIKGEKVDTRADIFSLGVLFWEMLSRQLPFTGETSYAIMFAITQKEPTPVTAFNPDVSEDLQEIINRCLQKDVTKRYQNIQDLQMDLKGLKKLYSSSSLLAPELISVTTRLGKTSKIGKKVFKYRRIVIVSCSILILLSLVLLVVPKFSNNRPASLSKAQLSIGTMPEGATVFLDGDSIGITPLNISPIEDRVFPLRLQKQDYLPIDRLVTILEDDTTLVFYQLQPMARVAIIVDPPEAEVALDGKPIEPSRLANLQLLADKHYIRISAEGYETKDDEFTLAQGMNPTLIYSLDKITSSSTSKTQPEAGTIQLTSEPSGASVILNNKIVGKTPYFDKNVPTGDYQLIIRHVGYEDFSQNIAVRPGKTIPVMAKLMANGELSITSDPADASILLNGISAGKTPYTNNKISAGQYNILLRKIGYADYSTTITVGPEQPIEINVKLTALMGKLTILVRPFGSIYIDRNIIRKDTNIQFTTELPIGPKQIKVVHPQLGVWEKTVTIQTDCTRFISINFNKEVAITVTSYNESGEDLVWGDVYVDGKPTGKTTPAQLKLRVGQHEIEVRREGYVFITRAKVLNLDEDIKEPLVFRLKKID